MVQSVGADKEDSNRTFCNGAAVLVSPFVGCVLVSQRAICQFTGLFYASMFLCKEVKLNEAAGLCRFRGTIVWS